MTAGGKMAAGRSKRGGGEQDGGGLRPAMLADGQPRFPRWLPLPGIVLAALWAGYQGVAAEGAAGAEVLRALAWPGVAIFLVTTVAAYFGWRLDLD